MTACLERWSAALSLEGESRLREVGVNTAGTAARHILDIDVSREANLPQNEDGLWELADRMRVHKNTAFEACITDRARELFNK